MECGFEGRARDGNGLSSIELRTKNLGGECRMQSHPGLGTSIRISIPVRAIRTKVSLRRAAGVVD